MMFLRALFFSTLESVDISVEISVCERKSQLTYRLKSSMTLAPLSETQAERVQGRKIVFLNEKSFLWEMA